MRSQYPLTSWLSSRVERERMTASLSACRAVRGNSSLKRMPGTFVLIGLNGPRISAGASGLGSNVSCCGGPPWSHRKMQFFALPNVEPSVFESFGPAVGVGCSFACRSVGSDNPSAAQPADAEPLASCHAVCKWNGRVKKRKHVTAVARVGMNASGQRWTRLSHTPVAPSSRNPNLPRNEGAAGDSVRGVVRSGDSVPEADNGSPD